MKIYLLLIDHERFFFYSDPSEPPSDWGEDADPSEPPRSGVRGWIHAKFLKFQGGLETPALRRDALGATGLGLAALPGLIRTKRCWRGCGRPERSICTIPRPGPATRSAHSGTPTLASSGGASGLDVLQRNDRALCHRDPVDLARSQPDRLLVRLPGDPSPLVVWGIRRVRRAVIPTELYPSTALDLLIERDGDGKSTHAALDGAAHCSTSTWPGIMGSRPKKGSAQLWKDRQVP